MSTERQVWTREGLLTWDGRVLELFKTDGKTGEWRVHALTIVRWEIEQRRGAFLLKVFDHEKHYESALVDDAQRPVIDSLMAEVGATR